MNQSPEWALCIYTDHSRFAKDSNKAFLGIVKFPQSPTVSSTAQAQVIPQATSSPQPNFITTF